MCKVDDLTSRGPCVPRFPRTPQARGCHQHQHGEVYGVAVQQVASDRLEPNMYLPCGYQALNDVDTSR
jgi:hypothetical protein